MNNELELIALVRELEELKARYESLKYKTGWVEYKMVRNKIGAPYYYYYYRFRDGSGRIHSVYLGSAEAAYMVMRELERARELRAKIKALEREIKQLRLKNSRKKGNVSV